MIDKDTKSKPKLSIRESETIKRFENFNKCSEILTQFFFMGFKSFNALKAIVHFYYPEVDVVKLKRFWNCQSLDEDVVTKVSVVFEKLKKE